MATAFSSAWRSVCLFFLAGLPPSFTRPSASKPGLALTKPRSGVYLADKLKGLILVLLIGVPFSVRRALADGGDGALIGGFGRSVFITAFQLLMIVIFPTFIAPWFNKFEPLKEGEFRDRILALGRSSWL